MQGSALENCPLLANGVRGGGEGQGSSVIDHRLDFGERIPIAGVVGHPSSSIRALLRGWRSEHVSKGVSELERGPCARQSDGIDSKDASMHSKNPEFPGFGRNWWHGLGVANDLTASAWNDARFAFAE